MVRSYDESGRLSQESIFLNDILLQQSNQAWNPSGRTLQIEDHRRDFQYVCGQLKRLSTNHADLAFEYTHGLLTKKTTPFKTVSIHYQNGLPKETTTDVLGKFYHETLQWDRRGKLSSYTSDWPTTDTTKNYTYTPRGFLKNVNEETFTFDFGNPGNGILTNAPGVETPSVGLDPFGKFIQEHLQKLTITTNYDEVGQVTLRILKRNEERFVWDPWGRLTEVSNKSYSWKGTKESYAWKAIYDTLGRRLQTIYSMPRGESFVTTSLYDPEEEFQEIGIKTNGTIFWKLYQGLQCEAVLDNTGQGIDLLKNIQVDGRIC